MINRKEDDSSVIIISEGYEISGFLVLKENQIIVDIPSGNNEASVSNLPSGIYYVLPYVLDANGVYNYKAQEMFEVA